MSVGTELALATWPDAAAYGRSTILAVPVGATEQHGPHLPLGTDTLVAEQLARRLAARRRDVTVAPALPYGSSGEHAGFPGTLSIGAEALELVLVELVRSADDFAGVVAVSGHGGNAEPMARAAAKLRSEGRRVLAWWPRPGCLPPGTDAHAGRTETSMVLAVSAVSVRTEAARAGERRPLSELGPALRSEGVRAVSPNGVLGDPTGATPEEGDRLLDILADHLATAVAAEWGDPG